MRTEDSHFLAAVLRPNLLTPAEINRGLAAFGSAAALKSAPAARLRGIGLSPDRASRLQAAWSALDPQAEALRLRESDVITVSRELPGYPAALAEIPDPPPLLFVRGNPASLTEPTALAVVGSRRLSPYGKSAVRILVEPCAHRGVTIVSGLAYGVDAAAHEAALTACGKTAAVLASGVDRKSVGPLANLRLSDEIISTGGCLVSERPPGAAADKRSFPQRNRIIAALAPVTLVIEAAVKSGSLITARFALEFNREVLAVPGPINSAVSEGTNRLIAQGARPALTAAHVLEALRLQPVAEASAAATVSDPTHRRILDSLANGPLTVDDLIVAAELAPATVISALIELETAELTRENGNLVELSTPEN